MMRIQLTHSIWNLSLIHIYGIYGQDGTQSQTESGAYAETCKESIVQNGLHGWLDIKEREVKRNDYIKIFQYGTGSNNKINQ